MHREAGVGRSMRKDKRRGTKIIAPTTIVGGFHRSGGTLRQSLRDKDAEVCANGMVHGIGTKKRNVEHIAAAKIAAA
jgi:hypothetical protein